MKTEIKKLIIDPVRDPKKFDYFTKEDEEKFCDLIRSSGAISLYLYSKKILTRDGVKWLCIEDKSVRTIARGGVMYVPVSFFSDFLGKTVDSRDGFLPLISTCESLGIFAKTYGDGLLAVVGGEKIHDELIKNPRLVYAGGYATLGGYDTSSFKPEDYEAARERWRTFLVGSFETNDLSIPEVKAKVTAAEEKYEASRLKFNRDKNAVILFGSEPPKISYDLWWQYEHIENFANAWAMPGSKYYHDGEILSDILFGLEWMYENMYGEAEIEERGWRSVHDFDWCDWFVRGPDPLTNTMLLIGYNLPIEKRETYLRCFKWVVTFMRQGYIHPSASSRIRVCTKAALLLEDPEWMQNEFYDYDLLLEMNEEGEGARIDYTHMTHEYPYNLMYGRNNLERVMYVGAILGGTALEFTSPKQYNLFKLVRYMYEPLMYKGRAAIIFMGRGNGSTELNYGAYIVMQMLPMIGLFGEDEDNYIKTFIKRNSVLPEIRENVKELCPISMVKKYADILNDDSIPYDEGYEMAHAYFTSGRAVQQRNDYSFVVAMPTPNIQTYESCNEANRFGWYTGDGAIYLSTKDDKYTFDGPNFACQEKLLMTVPGTTVDTQKRVPWSYTCVTSPRGTRDFVGSLSVNEKYLTATVDYEAHHFDGDIPPSDINYGGRTYPHKNDLVAKKSYFMLDKECVCLGAGITSSTGYPVRTVVEGRNLIVNGDGVIGKESTAIDGKILPTEDFCETSFVSPKFAFLEGVAGYVFLDDFTVSAEKFTNTEYNIYKNGEIYKTTKFADPKRFFKLCIEHGANPKDASYAYATIPYATSEALAEYSAHPEVEIISNTKECQAIRKKSIGISSFVFHSAGACEEISVSAPCIVMICEENGKNTLRVSDPSKKLENIKIRIRRALKLLSADSVISVKCGEVTELDVNLHRSVGRPYTAIFEI